jgi:hypothetical protein
MDAMPRRDGGSGGARPLRSLSGGLGRGLLDRAEEARFKAESRSAATALHPWPSMEQLL